MLLLDSVYMLLGKPYGSHQNVYAIDIERSNELVLIDTGLDDADLRMIERNIESFGLSGRTIKDIFITHCHFDHAGNAEKFRKKGARIHIGSEDAEPVLSGNDRAIGFAYGIAFPKVGSVETVSDEEVFEFDGMMITALHTPGHSRGFMCYELKTGDKTILFSGDFLQFDMEGDPIPGVKVDPLYDYDDYLASAYKMSGKEYDAILPGHFMPVLTRGGKTGALLRELLVRRELYK